MTDSIGKGVDTDDPLLLGLWQRLLNAGRDGTDEFLHGGRSLARLKRDRLHIRS
jgi:hypothetical protein